MRKTKRNASKSIKSKRQIGLSETTFPVKIQGKDHSLIFVNGYNHEKLAGAQGRNYLDDQELYINLGQHPDSIKDTVIHEILHSIERQAGIDPNEKVVHPFAASIYQVFKENPELTKWLFLPD